MGSSRCCWIGGEAMDGLCFGEGHHRSIALFFEALCGMGGVWWWDGWRMLVMVF